MTKYVLEERNLGDNLAAKYTYGIQAYIFPHIDGAKLQTYTTA